MDTSKARQFATATATTAGRAVVGVVRPGRRTTGRVQQTLTVARPAGDVFAACRDVEVLSQLVDDGEQDVHVDHTPPRSYRWTVLGNPVDTELVVDPHGLSFTTTEGVTVFAVLVTPAPGRLGSEVRFTLDLPVPHQVAGGLVFTMLYRLRALLQTGEVPTLGSVPSTRTTRQG